MKFLVAGGAGFIGSHLCERLLAGGHDVVCLDNLCTGSKRNVAHLKGGRFRFVKADVIGHLSEAYEPGRTYVEAFARWLTRLFKAHGLILIDASHPRLKEMGRDVFCREISENSPSTRQAVAASLRLSQAGYSPQIPLHEGILNLFYADPERRTLQWTDGALGIKGAETSLGKETLLARAKENPSLFSPNVLLRPIYQDALLPTVA